MTIDAVLFGAIGSLVETSDLQRRAFNAAFAEAGLDWSWDGPAYRDMLTAPGGRRRVTDFAAKRGVEIDAGALHRAKVRHFRALALQEGLRLRPGVADVIALAHARGLPVGLVTTTGPETVQLLFDAMRDPLSLRDFDLVTNGAMVAEPKPSPEVYDVALAALRMRPGQVRAIEDTPESAASAIAAGIPVCAFPGWAAQGRAFPAVCEVVSDLGTSTIARALRDQPTIAVQRRIRA